MKSKLARAIEALNKAERDPQDMYETALYEAADQVLAALDEIPSAARTWHRTGLMSPSARKAYDAIKRQLVHEFIVHQDGRWQGFDNRSQEREQ